MKVFYIFFFFSSRRRHTRCSRDWSSDVCSSDLFWQRRPWRWIFSKVPCKKSRLDARSAVELARQHLRADPRSNAFARQPEYRTHVPVGAGQSQKFLPLAERAATCRRRAGGAICHPTDCPRASPPLRLSTNHRDRKSTRLNSSHGYISYAVFCLKQQ